MFTNYAGILVLKFVNQVVWYVFMYCCINFIDHWTMQEDDRGISKRQMKNQKRQQLQYHSQHGIKQYLSLMDISPRWAMRLKEKRSLMFLLSLTRLQWLFQIIHPKKCVVAEAYGFSSSYTLDCNECARMGNKFSLYFAMCLSNKFEENLHRFVKHWNDKHTK